MDQLQKSITTHYLKTHFIFMCINHKKNFQKVLQHFYLKKLTFKNLGQYSNFNILLLKGVKKFKLI
jgi:hypothetical protein